MLSTTVNIIVCLKMYIIVQLEVDMYLEDNCVQCMESKSVFVRLCFISSLALASRNLWDGSSQVGTENGEAVSQSKAFTQLNGNASQGKKDQARQNHNISLTTMCHKYFRFGNFWSEDAMMTDELSNEESNCWSIKHVTPTIMNLYFVLLCSECVF